MSDDDPRTDGVRVSRNPVIGSVDITMACGTGTHTKHLYDDEPTRLLDELATAIYGARLAAEMMVTAEQILGMTDEELFGDDPDE